ncbi:MAG: glycosyltransferase [Ruminococcus sp.]|nr:glycosyltransferase [Ruminococcus sp.]
MQRGNMCLISFVVPVYNVKTDFIKKCMDSILSIQTDELEVVIVDDCSTNKCGSICDFYQKKDKRVKVFHLTHNKGVSNARNIGISNSTGKWIVFVDADDWIEPNTYDIVKKQTKPDIDILIFSAYRNTVNSVHSFGTTERTTTFSRDGVKDIAEISKHILLQSIKTTHPMYDTAKYCWGKAFNKSFLIQKQLIFKNLSYCEDIVFMVEAFQKANKVVQIPERLYHYRLSANSTVNSYRKNAVQEQRSFLETIHLAIGNEDNNTIYYAALLSMQICITRYFFNNCNRMNLIQKQQSAQKCFSEWPYSDVFHHVDIIHMKPNEKRKALLIKYRLFLLYYLGTELRKIKSVRYQ